MRTHALPFTILGALVLAIVLPWFLAPGFLFLPDYEWVPQFDLAEYRAEGSSASLPFTLLIAGLHLIVGGALAQKLFLAGILLCIPLGMYLLAKQYTSRAYACAAGMLYLYNPWVFERLAAGHVHVLLGYAYLPIVLHTLRRLLTTPSTQHWVTFCITFALFPMASLHFAYIGAGVCSTYALVHLLCTHPLLPRTRTLLWGAGSALLLALTLNAYWFSTFFGPAGTLSRFGQADFEAYATLADPAIGVWATTLSLYGFWNQHVILPRDTLTYWWIASLVLILLSSIGVWRMVRTRDSLSIALGILFIPVLILAVGYGSPSVRPLIDALRAHVPLFAGLRETAKMTGLIAFTYALFAPIGCAYLISRVRMPSYLGITLLTGIAYLGAGTMVWGASGQIMPHEYPTEWSTANTLLAQDSSVQRALVLPWGAYLALDFAGGSSVANPATRFFSVPVIVGTNTNNEYLIDAEKTPWNDHLFDLLHGYAHLEDKRLFLTTEQVTHIILLKTADWERYAPIVDSPILTPLYESSTIAVYRITE
jgi:hypothetical protein